MVGIVCAQWVHDSRDTTRVLRKVYAILEYTIYASRRHTFVALDRCHGPEPKFKCFHGPESKPK
jgi:hypothetical protein